MPAPFPPRVYSAKLEERQHQVEQYLAKLAREKSFHFVDRSKFPELADEDFKDQVHLGESGRRKFTAFFVGQIDIVMSEDSDAVQ